MSVRGTRRFKLNLALGLLIVFTPLVLAIAIFPADWAGWLVAVATLALLVRHHGIARRPEVLQLVVVSWLARQSIAIIQSHFITLSDRDSEYFYELAVSKAAGSEPFFDKIGSSLYSDLLGIFYYIFGASRLLACELSILGFAVALRILLNISATLGITLSRWTIAGFCLLPSSIFLFSVPLREAWQCALVLLLCHSALRYRSMRNASHVVWMLLAGAGLAVQHRGLGIFAFTAIFISLYWSLGNSGGSNRQSLRIIFPLMGGAFVGFALAFPAALGPAFASLVSDESAADYADTQLSFVQSDAGAHYGVALDTSSLASIAITAPKAFALYMLAPLPWQIRGISDIYAFLEGVARLTLLTIAFGRAVQGPAQRRSQARYFILIYLALELLWSTGTANWGTSMRHHTSAYGLLILVGGGWIPLRQGRFRKARTPLR